jgi:hypothetical protein
VLFPYTASSSSPYINLCEVHFSESFRAYQQKIGLNAHDYTAHSSIATSLPSAPPDVPTCNTILSGVCDPIVDGASLVPESDNISDILTQGKMFKAPDAARLLSSIWSYRRKRIPNGVLSKYKSRLCVNGKEQNFGHDYCETFAPVAAWPTIHHL